MKQLKRGIETILIRIQSQTPLMNTTWSASGQNSTNIDYIYNHTLDSSNENASNHTKILQIIFVK